MPSLMSQRVVDSLDQAPVRSSKLASAESTQTSQNLPKAQDSSNVNIYAWVFSLLVDAMNYKQSTVVAESKNIASNAAQQSALNQAAEGINFSQIPDGNPSNATIQRIQQQNVQYNKELTAIQSAIVLSRQNGQVMMTNANTYVGQVQQDASEDSGWLQTLNQIGQSIVQMTQNI